MDTGIIAPLNSMELDSGGGAAAFPQMRERGGNESRTGACLGLVGPGRIGVSIGWLALAGAAHGGAARRHE
jgi:hypothetical protein